jgi:hypothetical protein
MPFRAEMFFIFLINFFVIDNKKSHPEEWLLSIAFLNQISLELT